MNVDARAAGTRIAVVVSGWPRLSESFALNELLALERAGLLAGVFATKHSGALDRHPAVAALDPHVTYLADGNDLQLAAQLVAALDGPVGGVHGYFAHQPAAVARQAAAILGVPFGFSAHAKDPRKVDPSVLADRARAAACIIACNPDVAAQLRAVGASPTLVPHGVDLDTFAPRTSPRHGGRLELLAVGRLVVKKGFGVLISSTRLLTDDWRLRIVGEGPLGDELISAAEHLGVADKIEFLGARTHAELPSLYHESDVVVVPSVIDSEGDRDGLPNVVLEAMACGLPVVGSEVAAIPTAVEHRVTGLLVEPGDARLLANAIIELGKDAELRAELGANARNRVTEQFGLAACTDRFLSIVEAAYG